MRRIVLSFGLALVVGASGLSQAQANTSPENSRHPQPRPAIAENAALKSSPAPRARPAEVAHSAAPARAGGTATRQTARQTTTTTTRANRTEAVTRLDTTGRLTEQTLLSRSEKWSHSGGGRIWCVPFAREVSGINLSGNAGTWWSAAENRYARGKSPVVGSVLNFRATRQIPMGHVAVVSKVMSERRILIDHANWQRNRISRGMEVVDVSPRNDWSQVRVEHSRNTMGTSVYPTYGFIYRTAANN